MGFCFVVAEILPGRIILNLQLTTTRSNPSLCWESLDGLDIGSLFLLLSFQYYSLLGVLLFHLTLIKWDHPCSGFLGCYFKCWQFENIYL